MTHSRGVAPVTCRGLLAAASLIACDGAWSLLFGQTSTAPGLEEILRHLDQNLSYYDSHVPNLFCDERVVSQMKSGSFKQGTVTDSVFRLRRSVNADHTASLEESRDIKHVDGGEASSQDLEGPSLLSGVFEGGLAVVSPSQAPCMVYALQKRKKSRPAEPYVIRFATELTPANSAMCLLQENSNGQAWIDPMTMQVRRLELLTSHHAIADGVYGKRELTVEYAPVLLGGETFWMPSTIAMRVTRGSGTFHSVEWSFEASYRSYHKLQVTSHIVPVPK